MATFGQKLDVTVTSDTTVVIRRPVRQGFKRLCFEVSNSADNALSDFALLYRPQGDADYYPVASDAADFTNNISFPLLSSTGDPTSLAKSSKVFLWADCHGVNAFRIDAASEAGSDTNLSIKWEIA